jgi:hypothetical protein
VRADRRVLGALGGGGHLGRILRVAEREQVRVLRQLFAVDVCPSDASFAAPGEHVQELAWCEDRNLTGQFKQIFVP